MRLFHSALLAALIVSASAGAETIALKPLSSATMDEMAKVHAVAAPYAERNESREHRLNVSAQSWLGGPPTPVVTATGTAPPRATGFVSFIGRVPPADCAGAVSARHVVGITNQSVVVQDRSGKLLSRVTIEQFWSDPMIANGFLTDPRILYDAVNDRWIAVTLFVSFNPTPGRVLIAFTTSGDPTSTWNRFSAAYDESAPEGGDFPIVGQTADAILISLNDYGSPSGGCLFVMPKSYGATPSVTRLRHSYFELTPITTNDTSRKVARTVGLGVVIYDLVNGALTNAQSYNANYNLQGLGPMCGVQLGTTNWLDCGLTEVESAVQRDGVIWAAQWVGHSIGVWRLAGGTARFYSIESADFSFAYPSIAVNRAGGVLVGYSVFSTTGYASAGYSYIDPAGNLSAPAILKNGEGTYAGFRWGDYTATVVDPADDLSFWTTQLYAVSPSSWGTRWDYVKLPPTPTHGRAVRR